jgi:uncharacterized protein YggE
MKRLAVVLFIILNFFPLGHTNADQNIRKRAITVNGQGKVSFPPDIATIQTGVVTHRAAAADALSANSEVMNDITDLLKTFDIASKDIQTSNINVRPDYKRNERGSRENEIVGYQVTNQLNVKVHNLEDLGKILDALVKAGSNQISGVAFGVDNPESLLNEARRMAVKDARSRAELYAQVAGVNVGEVLSISEGPLDFPQPMHFGRILAAESNASVPVSPGELEFQVNVNMSFGIVDKN